MVTGREFCDKWRWTVSVLLGSGMICMVAILAGSIAVAAAQTIDPHRLYEQRCGGCHTPHAGDFVRGTLVMSDGKLLGRRTGHEVRAFLEAGHGKLTPDEVESMVDHLMNIQRSGGLFEKKCIICHDRAVKLARSELVIKDGRLVGRYSKRDIEVFLASHGRLKADEVLKMVDVLKRQLATMEAK